MSAPQLLAQLDEHGLAPEPLQEMARVAHEWWISDAHPTVYLLASVFRDLADLFDDPQAVPTAQHTPFRDNLLPQLREILRLLSEGPVSSLPGHLIPDMLRAHRACCLLIRGADG